MALIRETKGVLARYDTVTEFRLLAEEPEFVF
jgi:hypothetical protein